VTGVMHPLPPAADMSSFNPMASERLQALGWQPGGARLLHDTVRAMAEGLMPPPAR
jgi:hypothetical protein